MPLYWVQAIDAGLDTLLDRYLTDEDKAVAERHHRGQRKKQTLAIRALARQKLEETIGKAGREWHFRKNEDGKPLLTFKDNAPGPHISFSHSGIFVAFALSPEKPIGIDIEALRKGLDFCAIAGALFTQDEQNLVADHGMAAFLAIWTAREAIAKATGIDFRRIALSSERLAGLSETRIILDSPRCGVETEINGRYALAVAW